MVSRATAISREPFLAFSASREAVIEKHAAQAYRRGHRSHENGIVWQRVSLCLTRAFKIASWSRMVRTRADHGGHRGGDSACAPDGHTRSLRGENVVFIVPQIVKVIEDAIPLCASNRTFANELWCRQSISQNSRS